MPDPTGRPDDSTSTPPMDPSMGPPQDDGSASGDRGKGVCAWGGGPGELCEL